MSTLPPVSRPVQCHLCRQQMYYMEDAQYVPELTINVTGSTPADDSVFHVHLACWNKRFGSDTPNKEQLAIFDVINALRAVVAALKPRIVTDGSFDVGTLSIISLTDAETLLNLLADAEAKLQLP